MTDQVYETGLVSDRHRRRQFATQLLAIAAGKDIRTAS